MKQVVRFDSLGIVSEMGCIFRIQNQRINRCFDVFYFDWISKFRQRYNSIIDVVRQPIHGFCYCLGYVLHRITNFNFAILNEPVQTLACQFLRVFRFQTFQRIGNHVVCGVVSISPMEQFGNYQVKANGAGIDHP